MLNISIDEIVNITNGKLIQGENIIINELSLDTRTIKKGAFFIAVYGHNFDGHNFVVEAYKKKAVGALVDINKFSKIKGQFKNAGFNDIPKDFIIIKVENSLRSYGLIAAFFRRRFNIKVIAVTGSNGKTTTKELIYNLLLTKYKPDEILKTEKNYNNEIGVPQAIFKLTPKIKVMVAELGINHIGEMQRLAYMVDPDYGVITNIGDTHLEFLKNDKIVAKAKAEMVPNLKEVLVFNFDDKYYNYFLHNSQIKVIGFSLNTQLDINNVNVYDDYIDKKLDGYYVTYCGESFSYKLLGEHNLSNLLGALTIVRFLGVEPKKIKKVIEKFDPLEDRGVFKKYKNATIYFDAYNANPTSVKAVLYFISNLEFKNKIAVLGDMMELGKKAMKHHTDVLSYAANLDFAKIFVYGKIYKRVFRERNVDKSNIKAFTEMDKLGEEIQSNIKNIENAIVLIKGSRKMEMENLLTIMKI